MWRTYILCYLYNPGYRHSHARTDDPLARILQRSLDLWTFLEEIEAEHPVHDLGALAALQAHGLAARTGAGAAGPRCGWGARRRCRLGLLLLGSFQLFQPGRQQLVFQITITLGCHQERGPLLLDLFAHLVVRAALVAADLVCFFP